jgi:RHS repeat-associated protein
MIEHPPPTTATVKLLYAQALRCAYPHCSETLYREDETTGRWILNSRNNFRGTATLSGATTTVTVKAKDASGNETTNQYEVDTSGSTTSYTYDANGNLTSDGTKTYSWNALNQLVEVKEGTTTIATFEYDGEGRRTEKVAAGLTHQYIYDAEDIAEERISGSSSDTIRHYHGAGIDEPLARKNSSDVVTYYLADHLGSIVQETDATGAVGLDREYDPWGALLQGASSVGYAFTGREWDPEAGLYYFRARYYSSSWGRFVGEDPIGLSGGDTNFFAYVLSNPIASVDPSGLQYIKNGTPGSIRLKDEDKANVYTDLAPGQTGRGDGAIVGDTVVKTTDFVQIEVTLDGKDNVVATPTSPRWDAAFWNAVQRVRGREESGNKGDYHEWTKPGRHPDWTDPKHADYCPSKR